MCVCGGVVMLCCGVVVLWCCGVCVCVCVLCVVVAFPKFSASSRPGWGAPLPTPEIYQNTERSARHFFFDFLFVHIGNYAVVVVT